MKRKLIILISALCIMISNLSGCIFLFDTFDANGYVERHLDINTESVQIDTVIAPTPSFNGDGDTYVVLNFSGNPILEEIKEKENWKQLPLTDNLTALVYGKENVYNGITNDDDELLIPQIENGYYYFENRHSDAKNKYGDSDVFDLVSYNYTIAIYDEDENILYFYSLNT